MVQNGWLKYTEHSGGFICNLGLLTTSFSLCVNTHLKSVGEEVRITEWKVQKDAVVSKMTKSSIHSADFKV